jgi:peptide-methionine (S)-S-oxide reductase
MRILLLALLLAGCSGETAPPAAARAGLATATFAGGCFWCMEPPFEKLPGVASVTSGYTGGHVDHPTYRQVSNGGTGHYEAVEIRYDPAKVTYAQLLDVFWRNVDPTNAHGQFCDVGDQYRTAIFVHDDAQRRMAGESKARVGDAKKLVIVTEILPAAQFHAAEAYHQDYAAKNPVRYKFYRFNCGRDARLAELWGSAR